MQSNLINKFKNAILTGNYNFDSLALEIFRFQYTNNTLYKLYIDSLGTSVQNVNELKEIPFLPIEFFKTHQISSTNQQTQKIYRSSGTGFTGRSAHHMIDNEFYLIHSKNIFESFYGSIKDIVIAAILPSYQQQGDSSLIAMTDYFIQLSNDDLSGYYLDELSDLEALISKANAKSKKVLIIGVTFALLSLSEKNINIGKQHIIMETGGMKGRGKELIRKELHHKLKTGLHIEQIHSEYGMTELTSQAYSKKDGLFNTPKSLKILSRDINDPFNYVSHGQTGGANIIDLGNFATCSFIETKDLIKTHLDGFEVLGRFDNSDLRGCNLLLV